MNTDEDEDLKIFKENSNNFEKSLLEIAEFIKAYRKAGYSDPLFRKLIYGNPFGDTDKIIDDLETGIYFIIKGRQLQKERNKK